MRKLNKSAKKIIFVTVIIAVIVALGVTFLLGSGDRSAPDTDQTSNKNEQPAVAERSVANFCSVYEEEKNALVGSDASYGDSLRAYRKLEAVSPDEIRADITVIRKGTETLIDDPSKLGDISLAVLGSSGKFSDYVQAHCKDT